jgi:hypothetical protein
VSYFEIEPGTKTLCKELNTGKGHTGFFYFDDKTISAEICSYDESFDLKPEKSLFLHTEKNQIVSLHSTIVRSASSRGRQSEGEMATYKQRIISNIAVIGHDRWESTDKLKRVIFSVKRSRELLKHKEKFATLANNKIDDKFDSYLFSETTNGMTIRADYGASFSDEYNAPTDISPYLEIEFDTGVTLFEYLDHVKYLVQFFSLSLGVHMKPSDIKICRFTRDEMFAALDANTDPGDYSVEYVWREIPVEDSDLLVGGSLVTAWDDGELAALRQCIVVWMERYTDWKKANNQMMTCLASRGGISADRLLAACKWFEEIPLTRTQAAITDEHIQIIAETAAEKGSQLGYAKIKDRITGRLKLIKAESNEERFSRLLTKVKQKFGSSIVDDAIIEHLKRAIEFRGKSAHGYFRSADESEFRVFAKSIYALEALCFLLTACDLPIHAAAPERAQSNSFIEKYRLAWKSTV